MKVEAKPVTPATSTQHVAAPQKVEQPTAAQTPAPAAKGPAHLGKSVDIKA